MNVKPITREVRYPHPPELVWRALTDPALLTEWLMVPEGFEPKVGCGFRFRTKPAPGFDGVIHCQVIEADPPRVLAYTWASTKSRERPTTVRWQLRAEADGATTLLLEHSGFRGPSGFVLRGMLGSGWGHKLRDTLPALLRGSSRWPVTARESAGGSPS